MGEKYHGFEFFALLEFRRFAGSIRLNSSEKSCFAARQVALKFRRSPAREGAERK
jgi:hypothetical protein